MGGEWIECTLADACGSIDYGLTASASDHEAGPRFLRITDIVSGHINWKAVPHVAADHEATEKYRLHHGDVVLARTGASTGASAYVQNPPPAVFASYLVRLKARPEFDSRFLAYYLKSEDFWRFIRGVLGDKSAQPNASASTMTKAPLRAPRDKNEQRAIAHILGTLDDKIELNRRMSEALEAMARALFKSWFVDFDPVRAKMEGRDPGLPKPLANLFPARLVDSELGEIPEGWRVVKLGELLELAYGKALKAEARREGKIPVYGSNGQVGWHDERLVAGPGIVVGRKGNPGVVTWVPTDFFPIDTTFYVVPKAKCGSLVFLFHVLRTHDLGSLGGDSAVPGLNRNLVYMSDQVLPPAPLLAQFEGITSALLRRVGSMVNESRTLAALRDALLPKLISGELRVKDAERFLARKGES
ncbi:restriction endonuclease subunit S [Candidatus Nitrospira inopinata]|jgi:type I restriction enzyme S subunit|uniref:Putative restriction modification system DNA specificity domain n=1 Tax=Candidatus Nitrospira inopinata TaxID=1715989 RepID=A0A0S4L1F0_9BACT